jgi:outer membrane protein
MPANTWVSINFGISILLVISVGYLFLTHPELTRSATNHSDSIVHDSTKSTEPDFSNAASLPTPANVRAGEGIYFVNTDTLLAKYKVFKKSKAVLEAKGARFEADLDRRMSSLQAELAAAQQKVQSGSLTQSQAQELEGQFMQKQQALAAYKDEQTAKLMEDEKNLSLKLNADIQKFMKQFARSKGFKYVLGYTTGGGILYASDSLDITKDVVRGINGE